MTRLCASVSPAGTVGGHAHQGGHQACPLLLQGRPRVTPHLSQPPLASVLGAERDSVHTHTLTHTHSHTHTHTHTHTLTYTFTQTHSHRHTHSLTHTQRDSLILSHTHTLTHSHTERLTHSYFLTHTHSHTLTHTLTLTHSHTATFLFCASQLLQPPWKPPQTPKGTAQHWAGGHLSQRTQDRPSQRHLAGCLQQLDS